MAGALKAVAMILPSVAIITTDGAPAPAQALMTEVGAMRMSVLITDTVSITNTIAGLVRRIRTSRSVID